MSTLDEELKKVNRLIDIVDNEINKDNEESSELASKMTEIVTRVAKKQKLKDEYMSKKKRLEIAMQVLKELSKMPE